ncbi:MAG: asparagine synthetase B, partial [Magnetospirillum sp.]
MCGIAGTVNLDGAPADGGIVAGMAAAIAHRGPDGQGEWVEGPVGFGHRRLAIIDLSDRAVQPMVSADERHVIVYNGEIYNYLELRAELEDAGHRFRSASDTEVVLTALAAWGRKALLRFNGMFALAMFDRHARTLMLARDRYGIKPLYIARRGTLVAFGSEVKALLAHPAIEAGMDLEALVEYLTFQNYFSNRTLFRGIEMLPPGTCEEIRFDTGASTRHRYWDFCFHPVNTRRSQADTVEEFLGLFD